MPIYFDATLLSDEEQILVNRIAELEGHAPIIKPEVDPEVKQDTLTPTTTQQSEHPSPKFPSF